MAPGPEPWLAQPWFRPDGSREGVLRGLGRMAEEPGVAHFSFTLARGAGGRTRHGDGNDLNDAPVQLSNLPPSWLSSTEVEKQVDPVLQMAMRGGRPFVLEWERFPRTLPRVQRRFLVEAARNGLRNWLAVPVQGALGSFGVFRLVDADAVRHRESTAGSGPRRWTRTISCSGRAPDRRPRRGSMRGSGCVLR